MSEQRPEAIGNQDADVTPHGAAAGDVARNAEAFVATLDDGARGRLASALLDSYSDDGESTARLATLRLDSADPSLMSRADVAALLADTYARDRGAVERAIAALASTTVSHSTLGAIFAPSRGSSDTSTLGGDPTQVDDDTGQTVPQ